MPEQEYRAFRLEQIDDGVKTAVRDETHDNGCHNQTAENCRYRFFDLDMKQSGDEASGPGTGTGERNADKE